MKRSDRGMARVSKGVHDDGRHNSLLLLDDYKVHKSQAVKESLQSNGIYVQAITF